MSMDTVPAYVGTVDDADSTAEPGRVDAALTFRLGMADTTYQQHGELHVLTGLALRALSGFDVDGAVTVGTVTTSFTVAGRTAEVCRALDALTAWMRAPSWSAVDDVVAAVRRDGALGLEGTDEELRLAALARWGREGVGLLGCAPHCGYAAGVDRLDRWRTRFLTAGNSVLSGAGGAMDDLVLRLPSGSRVPAPVDRSLRDGLPAWRGAVGLGPVPVLTALTSDPAVTRTLSALLTRELNDQPAVARVRTASRARALPVGTGLFWLYTHRAGTASRLLAALDRIADEELPAEDLEAVAAAASTAPSALARAEGAAMAALLGTPEPRAVTEVTPDELTAEARRARESLLLLSEEPVPEEAGLPEASPAPVPDAGTVLYRYHGGRSSDELIIADNICEMRVDGLRERLAWDQVVGVHRAEHDVRRLVPHDGPELVIDAHEWRYGRHALSMVDGHVDDDLVIHEPDPDDLLHGGRPWQEPSVLVLAAIGLAVLLALVLLGVWIAT